MNAVAKSICILFLFVSTYECLAHTPKVFAHRGGKAEFPENTIYAYQQSLAAGADGLELDVQLTKDNMVVAYHPKDLSANTNGYKTVAEYNYEELYKLDVAFKFDPQKNYSFPQRAKGHYIPKLDEVLKYFPKVPIVIDFKSTPVEPLVEATIKVIDNYDAWKYVVFYSTDARHLQYLIEKAPKAKIFEHRNITRKRLLSLRNNGNCCCKSDAKYVGFELDRIMKVAETFTLGEDGEDIHFRLWDEQSIACIRRSTSQELQIFLFGINTQQDYMEAKKLKVDAVFSDAPSILNKLTLSHIDLVQRFKLNYFFRFITNN